MFPSGYYNQQKVDEIYKLVKELGSSSSWTVTMVIYSHAYRVNPSYTWGQERHTVEVTCVDGVITTTPSSVYIGGGDEDKSQGIRVYIDRIEWVNYREL